MSKRLTEEKIQELIFKELEKLDEFKVTITAPDLNDVKKLRSKTGTTGNPNGFSPSKTKTTFKTLRDLDKTGDTNVLDNKDVEAAKGTGGTELDLAKWLTQTSSKTNLRKDWSKILGTDYNPDVDKTDLAAVGSTPSGQSELDDEEMPFSRPTMYSKGSESGKFGGAILKAFDTLFGGASTLKERIDILNNASKAAMGIESDIQTQIGRDLRKQLNLAICLDYINAFAKNMDHGSGGYLFEAFVALLTSGRVVGKAMGGEDGVMLSTGGEELLSSAKYYSKTSSSQAVSKFPIDQPVTYVFAYKKDDVKGSAKGVSDPDKIAAIDLHIFTVTLDSSGNVSVQGDGNATKNKGNIDLSLTGTNPTGTLFLAKKKGESFQESLENQIKNNDKQIEESFKNMKLYFQETARANKLAKQYLSAQSPNAAKKAGTDSLSAMAEADAMLTNLFNSLKSDVKDQKQVDKLDPTGKDRTLSESKLQSLDKLILEILQESLDK